MELKIKKQDETNNEINYLYYDSQRFPQKVYLYLELFSGKAWVTVSPEIGNTCSCDVWDGRTLRWELSCGLLPNFVNELLEELIPEFQSLLNTEKETEENYKALAEVERKIEKYEDCEYHLNVWQFDDFYQNSKHLKDIIREDFFFGSFHYRIVRKKLIEQVEMDLQNADGVNIIEDLEEKLEELIKAETFR